jgi:RNA polymerase sigma-70 factor, ECF subfamily
MHLVNGGMLERWNRLTDERIAARVLAGRTALFEVLMLRHNERIYRAVRAVVRDDRTAEDVMQHAYLSAYSNLRRFDGRASFVTWLTRIAIAEALARSRCRNGADPI